MAGTTFLQGVGRDIGEYVGHEGRGWVPKQGATTFNQCKALGETLENMLGIRAEGGYQNKKQLYLINELYVNKGAKSWKALQYTQNLLKNRLRLKFK